MTETYAFMGEHVCLTAFLAFLVFSLLIMPFRLISRWIRHRNIVAAGWPPPHLDADGDTIAATKKTIPKPSNS